MATVKSVPKEPNFETRPGGLSVPDITLVGQAQVKVRTQDASFGIRRSCVCQTSHGNSKFRSFCGMEPEGTFQRRIFAQKLLETFWGNFCGR
ncbi:hypothetical protein BD410DRAFT_621524 [Rickenella mellea]|uniref:Uncharacterized protein n=1 Tax=Rickenella mellea TaxID=50990 RepID=A0A4Y7PM12_9AGAM|nr:hypothetical protein BD410DRAFT_621524 [Rickenella mellea]